MKTLKWQVNDISKSHNIYAKLPSSLSHAHNMEEEKEDSNIW